MHNIPTYTFDTSTQELYISDFWLVQKFSYKIRKSDPKQQQQQETANDLKYSTIVLQLRKKHVQRPSTCRLDY